MKQSEFVRWLKAQGVQIKDGTKHLKLSNAHGETILPRHPAKELKVGTVQAVKKKLNLK